MTPLMTVALVCVACCVVCCVVSGAAIAGAVLLSQRNANLVEGIADRLKARDLGDYKYHDNPPPLPDIQPLADPEMRGLADMRAHGLDPDNPEHVFQWNHGGNDRMLGGTAVGEA